MLAQVRQSLSFFTAECNGFYCVREAFNVKFPVLKINVKCIQIAPNVVSKIDILRSASVRCITLLANFSSQVIIVYFPIFLELRIVFRLQQRYMVPCV